MREVSFFWTIVSYWLPNCFSWKWTPGGQEGAAVLCCAWSLCYELWVRGRLKCFTGVQITWTFWVWERSSGLWVLCSVCAGGWAHKQAAKGKMLFLCFKACMSNRHWGTVITVRNIIRKKNRVTWHLISSLHKEPNRWSMSAHLFLHKLSKYEIVTRDQFNSITSTVTVPVSNEIWSGITILNITKHLSLEGSFDISSVPPMIWLW